MAVGSFKELFLYSLKINEKLMELLSREGSYCPSMDDYEYIPMGGCEKCELRNINKAKECWRNYVEWQLKEGGDNV